MAGARSQPVVLALEDLHWADPTTLDVLRGIAERGALAPLFVLMTTRPEFRPSWGTRSHHCTVSLVPLDHAQVRHMVEELAARHALSSDVVDHVAARTGGVPLFVEEVTRLLMERGERGGTQAIPPTLQQSLMARLDRLGPARELAQIGSVIGRGFSYALLRALAGMADSSLQAALKKIAEADILLVQGLPPDSDYRFKHALIQDAAYENLLKSRRQVMHRHVAEILRDRFADTAAAEPEVLAHHFTQAGMTDEAIEWWGEAGDQALHRSAFQEAIFHLSKAIEMADKEGETLRAIFESLKQFLGNREKEFRAWDLAGELPASVLEELRQFGLFGLVLPEDAGGLGLGNTAYSRTLQELSRYDGSVAATVGAHSLASSTSSASNRCRPGKNKGRANPLKENSPLALLWGQRKQAPAPRG